MGELHLADSLVDLSLDSVLELSVSLVLHALQNPLKVFGLRCLLGIAFEVSPLRVLERGKLALALEFLHLLEHARGLRLDHLLANLTVPGEATMLREELPLLDSESSTLPMVPLVAHVAADDVLVVIYSSVADAVHLGRAITLSV